MSAVSVSPVQLEVQAAAAQTFARWWASSLTFVAQSGITAFMWVVLFCRVVGRLRHREPAPEPTQAQTLDQPASNTSTLREKPLYTRIV